MERSIILPYTIDSSEGRPSRFPKREPSDILFSRRGGSGRQNDGIPVAGKHRTIGLAGQLSVFKRKSSAPKFNFFFDYFFHFIILETRYEDKGRKLFLFFQSYLFRNYLVSFFVLL